MRLSLHRNRLCSFTIKFVGRFLAIVILSSFAVTQLPIVNSLAEQASMPCCAGKSSEHCDSGLNKPKVRPVITEPMCGVDPSSLAHALLPQPSLLTAETTSQNADAESNASELTAESVGQTCRMDCGACATAVSRNARDKSLVHSRTTHTSTSTTAARYNSRATFFSSNEKWTRIVPRGPPASSLSS
jgi:hypothetical protein